MKKLLLIIPLLIMGCQKESEFMANEVGDYDVIGPDIPIPQEKQNMQEVYDSIRVYYGLDARVLPTTDLYIKLYPADDKQLGILMKDTTLYVADYPFHRDLETPGTYSNFNVEESYCDTCIGSVFVCVDADYNIPDCIARDTICEIYFPENDQILTSQLNEDLFSQIYDVMESYAHSRVGLTYDDGTFKTMGNFWTPSGKIQFHDRDKQVNVNLQGLHVVVKKGLRTGHGYTNGQGQFTSDKDFKGKVRYKAIFEDDDFVLKNTWNRKIRFKSNRLNTSWTPIFNSTYEEYVSLVWRASRHYYNKNINGLTRPPGFVAGVHNPMKMVLKRYGGPNGSYTAGTTGRNIMIQAKSSSSELITAITFHELSHSALWEMHSNKQDYFNKELRVVESLARGVEWSLTKKYYSGYDFYSGFVKVGGVYTGVARDLVDGVDFANNDWVSGYTIVQVENAAHGADDWAEWEDNVKNGSFNSTKMYVSDLFDYWD